MNTIDRNSNRRSVVCCLASVLSTALIIAVAAAQAMAADGPLIDIVVTSNFKSSEKQEEQFIESLRSHVKSALRQCLPDEDVARKVLADGKTRFRIKLDHQTDID